MSYSVSDYSGMLADERRIRAYLNALTGVIDSESVVLDLGSGVGIFALAASRLGARKVIAIDPNPNIWKLKELARDNHCEIDIHCARAQDVELSEKANVLVFDVRGALPLYKESMATIIDARKRLCTPTVTMLPAHERIFFQAVSSETLYRQTIEPWGDSLTHFDLSALLTVTRNSWCRRYIDQERPIAEPIPCFELDYAEVESTSFENTLRVRATDSSVCHGFFLYTQVDFPDGTSYNCGEHREVCVSGSGFFPFYKPLEIVPDDLIECTLCAHALGTEYLWSWRTTLTRGGRVIEKFEQSTLAQFVSNQRDTAKRHADYTPKESARSKIAQLVLGMFSKELSLGSIADHLVEEFPREFKDRNAALTFASQLSERFAD